MKFVLWGAVLVAICAGTPSEGFAASVRDPALRAAGAHGGLAAKGPGGRQKTLGRKAASAVSKTRRGIVRVASPQGSLQTATARRADAPRVLKATAAAASATRDMAPAAATAESTRVAVGSIGDSIGLHRVSDPLALRSAVALVIDAETSEVLYAKNTEFVLPIASLTKLMTAMVVLDAGQPLDAFIEITDADRDRIRSSRSKLPIGSRLTRRELLQLALMASENRAASALARNYPGGLAQYRLAANRKALALGMRDSVFADGTGLSASNVSTAPDLARMVRAASGYRLIAEYSTASEVAVRLPRGSARFHTTNRLVGSPTWELELQKTGYIDEAGNCMVLKGNVDEHKLIIVLLDSFGRHSRLGDAERIRRWLGT